MDGIFTKNMNVSNIHTETVFATNNGVFNPSEITREEFYKLITDNIVPSDHVGIYCEIN